MRETEIEIPKSSKNALGISAQSLRTFYTTNEKDCTEYGLYFFGHEWYCPVCFGKGVGVGVDRVVQSFGDGVGNGRQHDCAVTVFGEQMLVSLLSVLVRGTAVES